MKASQFLVVVSLLVLPPFAQAEFDPNSLTDLVVVAEKPCLPWYCVEVMKDDVLYLIVLESDRKTIGMIFLIKGKELELVWGNWI
jgi:hypothetical protein